jgi:hypothetical protein
MIAPGTLCSLRNPMGFNISFRQYLGDPVLDQQDFLAKERIDPAEHLFTIISIPHRRGNEHYAWGMLDNGRLGFINCKWLIEVRNECG